MKGFNQAWRYARAARPTIMTAVCASLALPVYAATVDEIVVTTRRTEENLQDIPVAVTAFGEEFIRNQAIRTTDQIAALVPGVQFDQSFSAADTRITIRGVASERGRTSSAVLIDGIDVTGENITAGGGSSLLNVRLLDLERVEVIKGPQSALYGRNAFAGAISYITRQPSLDETEINLFADYGTFETTGNAADVRASISGPVVEGKLALGLNVGYFDNSGFYRNNNPNVPAANSRLNGEESIGARLSALWTPTDNLAITANLSYSDREVAPRGVVKVGNANTFYLMGNRLPPGTAPEFSFLGNQDYGQWLGTVPKVSASDINLSISERTNAPFEGSKDETLLAYVKLDWDLGSVTFKSNTSYLDNEASLQEDAEYQDGVGTVFMGVGLSLANDYFDETDSTYINQEFTLESNDWDRGSWLVGIQYFRDDTKNVDQSLGWYNDPFIVFVPGLCGSNPFQAACSFADSAAAGVPPKITERDTDSRSIFGLVNYDITDKLSVTAEARYIRDEITVTTNTAIDRVSQYILNVPIDFSFGAPPVLPARDTQSSNTINPRLALDYSLNDDVLFYGSAAKGTKPAGFGTAQFATPQNARIDQEKLYAYEIGAKTSWADGALQANIAVFYNDYQDRQVGVTVVDPNTGWPAAGIVNAAEATTQGLEVDITWRPIDELTLALAYSFTDAEWDDFNYTTIRAQSGDVVDGKDMAICGNAQGDCSGAQLAGVPENAMTLIGNYTAPLSGELEWFVNIIGSYQDERALFDRVDTAFVDSFWNWDAQIGLQTEQWTVQLYSTNLLDDETPRWAQGYQDFRDGMYGGGFGGEPRDESVFAFLPPPRQIGLRASYRF
jgi:outer membrane receptor protein involved in Fe transport